MLKIRFLIAIITMLLMLLMSNTAIGRPNTTTNMALPAVGLKLNKPAIPRLPYNFPKVFPKYTRCWLEVAGVRVQRACYDKKGVRSLLQLWARYVLLEPVAAVALLQFDMIENLKLGGSKLHEANTHLGKALLKSKEAVKALQTKLNREARRKTMNTIKTALIVTGIIVGSLAVGIVGGYIIGVLQPH